MFYFSCVAGCRVTKIFDPEAGGRRSGPPRAAPTRHLLHRRGTLLARSRRGRRLHARRARTPHYIVAALERGLHVLVEKPLTDSVEGLRAIRRAAAAAPAQVVAVVHQMRFVPLHQRIKALVDGRHARRAVVPRGLLRSRSDDARLRATIAGAKTTTRRRWSIRAVISSTCCAGSPARRSSRSLRRRSIARFPSTRNPISTW